MAKDLKKSKLAKFDQFLSYCLYLSLKCTVCDFYTDTYILFSSLSLSLSLSLPLTSHGQLVLLLDIASQD